LWPPPIHDSITSPRPPRRKPSMSESSPPPSGPPRQTGLGRDDLLAQLAQVLPGVVDGLTPHGRRPNRCCGWTGRLWPPPIHDSITSPRPPRRKPSMSESSPLDGPGGAPQRPQERPRGEVDNPFNPEAGPYGRLDREPADEVSEPSAWASCCGWTGRLWPPPIHDSITSPRPPRRPQERPRGEVDNPFNPEAGPYGRLDREPADEAPGRCGAPPGPSSMPERSE
jgi:hypothetical protein